MLVAIHAYEGIYQGLHGIEDHLVAEVLNEEEAYEIGEEMSYGVMDSYSDIIEEFEQNAEFEGLEEGSPDWDNYIEECYSENVAYDIHILKETTKSLEDLNELFFNDPEGFIATYCEK